MRRSSPQGTHFQCLTVASQFTHTYYLPAYQCSSILAPTSPITLLLLRTCPFNKLQMGERFEKILLGKVFGGRKKKHIMFIHVFMYVCICWLSDQILKKFRRIHITIWFSCFSSERWKSAFWDLYFHIAPITGPSSSFSL